MRTTPAALALLALLVASCSADPAADRAPAPPEASTPTSGTPGPQPEPRQRTPRPTMVLAISVDGLASYALDTLGPAGAPTLWALMDRGASTLNARTEVELTVTLPNHTGMLTGRRVDAAHGGHGWIDNVDTGGRVVGSGDQPVASIFDVVDEDGGTSALFASKDKFAVFDRTWPAIDRFVYDADNAALGAEVADDLVAERRDFTFLHLSWPDDAGHATGWGSEEYLDAVGDVDDVLGDLVETIDDDRYLRRHLALVLTADHGGGGMRHAEVDDPDNFTVPFLVVGPGVPAGADLYALDPDRSDPGTVQPPYTPSGGPVRNGDVANLAAALLGLDPVPGSLFGAETPLAVTAHRR